MKTATQRRDVRTGTSVWQSRRLPSIPCRALSRDATADVLVIGMGVSGAMTADALSEAGLRVAMVDRRGAVQGSTPASTALLLYEIDMPLVKLSARIGVDRAQRVWARSRLALDALRARAGYLGIDADIEDRDSLYLEGDQLDTDGLREEADARRRMGLATMFLDRRAVKERYGIERRAAILSFHGMSADPRRLTAGFLTAALHRGARLYAPVEVTSVEPDRSGVSALTSNGRVIRSKAVVFAAGYDLPKGVPEKGHTISSTWVLATRPQPGRLWRDQCLIWEASDPYLYLRVGPAGRIICGGEDEPFADEGTRDAMMDEKIAAIEAKLGRLMPRVDPRAQYAWTGSFGGSRTGTPSIGPVPHMPNCYAVLGYGGNGITFSMMAAQMLRGMITGVGDTDADLFSFNRSF
ncbi:MAG: FAD-dependent oxidoreductase [bacterium]